MTSMHLRPRRRGTVTGTGTTSPRRDGKPIINPPVQRCVDAADAGGHEEQRHVKSGFRMLAAVAMAVAARSAPAQAWWFEDDGRSWPVFAFHEYDGSDVNRPGGTPDRPYWHGDDAVPLGMRWQDLEAARAEAAAADAAAAAAAAVKPPRPRGLVHRALPHRRRFAVQRPARICVPAPVAAR